MTLSEMTTSELRTKIQTLKSSIELSELMVKTWTERGDEDRVEEKVQEQQDIIEYAKARIEQILDWYKESDEKIKDLGKSIRYDEKQLRLYQNRRDVLKLMKLQSELNGV